MAARIRKQKNPVITYYFFKVIGEIASHREF